MSEKKKECRLTKGDQHGIFHFHRKWLFNSKLEDFNKIMQIFSFDSTFTNLFADARISIDKLKDHTYKMSLVRQGEKNYERPIPPRV